MNLRARDPRDPLACTHKVPGPGVTVSRRPAPLKAAAAARGLTLTEVAEATGYSAGTVGQVSRGTVEPWPEFRRRMTDLFGRDVFAEVDQ